MSRQSELNEKLKLAGELVKVVNRLHEMVSGSATLGELEGDIGFLVALADIARKYAMELEQFDRHCPEDMTGTESELIYKPEGVEVLVNVAGECFRLHRTQYDGDERTSKSNGWSATNEIEKGKSHWVFIPMNVVGTLGHAVGGHITISFSDVLIGPAFGDPTDRWVEKAYAKLNGYNE